MDNAFRLHTAADYPLERGFWAIRHDFGIYAPIASEQSKNNGFAAIATASDTPDPLGPESGFHPLRLRR